MYSRLKKNQVNKSNIQSMSQQKQNKIVCSQQKYIYSKQAIQKPVIIETTNIESNKKIGNNNILSKNTYIITENRCPDEYMIKEIVKKEMDNLGIDETKNINVVINNLSINTCLSCDITKHFTTVSGTYQSNNIRVHNLKGIIELGGIKINEINNIDIYGQISIYNTENGTLFSGIVHIVNGNIEYILSNRPLIQIKTSFSGIISLFIKIKK